MEIAWRIRKFISFFLPNKLLRWQGKRNCYDMIVNDMKKMTDDEKREYVEQLKGLLKLID